MSCPYNPLPALHIELTQDISRAAGVGLLKFPATNIGAAAMPDDKLPRRRAGFNFLQTVIRSESMYARTAPASAARLNISLSPSQVRLRELEKKIRNSTRWTKVVMTPDVAEPVHAGTPS